LAFVDLEKAFDSVPRVVLWWGLRYVKLKEWIMDVVRSVYTGVSTVVKQKNVVGKEFVRVVVHQGSVLSPLLFIIMMEAMSSSFKQNLPWEILYADDLVLVLDSQDYVPVFVVPGRVRVRSTTQHQLVVPRTLGWPVLT